MLPVAAFTFMLPVINAAPKREAPLARIVRLEKRVVIIDLTVGFSP